MFRWCIDPPPYDASYVRAASPIGVYSLVSLSAETRWCMPCQVVHCDADRQLAVDAPAECCWPPRFGSRLVTFVVGLPSGRGLLQLTCKTVCPGPGSKCYAVAFHSIAIGPLRHFPSHDLWLHEQLRHHKPRVVCSVCVVNSRTGFVPLVPVSN